MKSSLIIILAFVFFASSCGLGDSAKEDQGVFDLSNLNSSCKLDTEKIAKIFEVEVHKEINCLRANLDQFVQYVRRVDPDYVSRSELEKFVGRFFPENAEKIRDLLTFVYDLNTLLLKDPSNRISVKKLGSLFDLFHLANDEGRVLFQALKNHKEKKYWDGRREIYSAIEQLASKALVIIQPYNKTETSLNIITFLNKVKDIFDLDDDQLDIDLIDGFLFVKKLLTGGQNRVLTSGEVEYLLGNISEVGLMGLDLINVKHKTFKTDSEKHFFWFDVVRDIVAFIYPMEGNELIITHDQLIKVAEKAIDTDWDLKKIGDTLINIKPKFIGGDAHEYQFADIMTIIDWAVELTGRMYFNDVTYDHFEKILNSPDKIDSLKYPALEEYNIFPKKLAKKNWAHFEFIATKFRYFTDNDGINHYFSQYHRFRSGFNQISLFRYFLDKVMKVYGHIPEGERVKQADVNDVSRFLLDIEGAAREFGLWPKDFERFVGEAVNGSDLFQFNGNGNGLADHNEFTEYIITIFSANKHADKIHERLQNYCPLVGEDGESFEINCYREYFLHIFFNELNLDRYYDRLKHYITRNGWEEARMYMINLEYYAREIPNPNLPLSRIDLTRLVIAFSNLEATYLRFDANKNGILEKPEIDKAYLVFKNLLVTFAKLPNASDKFVHNVFLFLIKYMENPTDHLVKFGKFYAFGKKDQITGTRFNIAAILRMFVPPAEEKK